MSKIHIIIDFMHIYYKYYFERESGRLRELSFENKCTTMIYYPLHDINSIRKSFEEKGYEVVISICFDTKSKRKEQNTKDSEKYKSNRKNRLTEEDFGNINTIMELLNQSGYNVYRIDGYEADDIINYLIRKYSNNFQYNIIYTNDKDLIINVSDNVGVMRYKVYKGYTPVGKDNYSKYLEPEFKAYIPYNALGLYLASVGDKSDCIDGIHRFGPKAFTNLMESLNNKYNINWEDCGNYNNLLKVVEYCKEFLTAEQYEQLYNSFKLVSNTEMLDDLHEPSNISTAEKREYAYTKYNMISLI